MNVKRLGGDGMWPVSFGTLAIDVVRIFSLGEIGPRIAQILSEEAFTVGSYSGYPELLRNPTDPRWATAIPGSSETRAPRPYLVAARRCDTKEVLSIALASAAQAPALPDEEVRQAFGSGKLVFARGQEKIWPHKDEKLALIQGYFTEEQYRCKGLARLVHNALCRLLVEEGFERVVYLDPFLHGQLWRGVDPRTGKVATASHPAPVRSLLRRMEGQLEFLPVDMRLEQRNVSIYPLIAKLPAANSAHCSGSVVGGAVIN